MASGAYERFKANLMNKEIDLEADTIKVALMDTNHTFTSTNNTWSQVSANEVSGTGYTAGGATLANKAVTQAATTKWDADDVTWSTTTIADASHAVVYDDTMTNDDLIISIDFGGSQSTTAADFTIAWNAAGIVTIA